MKNIYFFIGTTTELIKLAPVMHEFEKRKIGFKIITSGQTKVNFSELSAFIKKDKADIILSEKVNKSSIFIFLIWSITTIIRTPVLSQEFKGLNSKNTYFIVHGDPVSSLIGALIAKFYGLKLVHIESGLRSFNFLEPFPEEICRYIISCLADIHFCPNEWSLSNLKGIKGKKVNTYQNTMIESYLFASKNKRQRQIKKKYFILIVHRQEHVIFGKKKSKALIEFIFKNMEMQCVFVKHATTAKFFNSMDIEVANKIQNKVTSVSRMKYFDFVSLLQNSEFIITDGGTNQEEAYYMGLPCLILRNYTERIDGLGENAVLAMEDQKIIKYFIHNYKKYRREKVKMRVRPSKIIVDELSKS